MAHKNLTFQRNFLLEAVKAWLSPIIKNCRKITVETNETRRIGCRRIAVYRVKESSLGES